MDLNVRPQNQRVPLSTYRLQMHAGFNLKQAIEIIPYLNALGISHVYLSSLLVAKAGSTHGYDVCDHSRLNPEIGTPEELEHFSKTLKQHQMGILLDVVPNHMSVGSMNAWWADVLENGPTSPYAGYFDIVWNDHPREQLRGKVLLPILGTSYGEAIDQGLFHLAFNDGMFSLSLYDQPLPIDPRTYGLILEKISESMRNDSEDTAVLELQSILTAIRHLPARTETDTQVIANGLAEIKIIKRRLKEFANQSDPCRSAILERIHEIEKDPIQLDRLIDAQAYRPCFWRVASDEINYRRFFDVNDLAALSTEKEQVFHDIHKQLFEWVQLGYVDGFRIDHPDGLFDPKQYLERLQKFAPRNESQDDLYVVVEKILGQNEELRADWRTDGTTGYELMHTINSLFVDERNESKMTEIYERFIENDESFDDIVYRKKFLILQSSMTSELHVLTGYLDRLAQADRSTRDLTLNGLRHALREVLCCFPIYRTYIDGTVSDVDHALIRKAVYHARRRNPLLGHAVFDFLRDTLLLRDPKSGTATPDYRALQIQFAGKFQQLSAPVMAKGFEDTALYIYNRLVSLNEVGSDPRYFGRKPEKVHAVLSRRPRGGLSPLSTHDTKRSEDVRARINVLSEIPEVWRESVQKWSVWNRTHRVELEEGAFAPDGNEEYLLYQTLIGTWPDDRTQYWDRYVSRISDYMIKAIHESKVHSSWINPDANYDAAIVEFTKRILDPNQSKQFLTDMDSFHRSIRLYGKLNSLGQSLIRCTVPGVPDLYQGTELWDDSLVDPDNRRPVDFTFRNQLLKSCDENICNSDWKSNLELRHIKMLILSRALKLRQQLPELFEHGEYSAVTAIGSFANNIFAFTRKWENQCILVLVSRLMIPNDFAEHREFRMPNWNDTSVTIPSDYTNSVWENQFTGICIQSNQTYIPIEKLLRELPVALLVLRN